MPVLLWYLVAYKKPHNRDGSVGVDLRYTYVFTEKHGKQNGAKSKDSGNQSVAEAPPGAEDDDQQKFDGI